MADLFRTVFKNTSETDRPLRNSMMAQVFWYEKKFLVALSGHKPIAERLEGCGEWNRELLNAYQAETNAKSGDDEWKDG